MTERLLSIGAWGGILLASVVVGCSNQTSPADSAKSQETAIPDSAAGPLPELGEYLPPLDEGRLETAPPADWIVPPRSNKYLVRYQGDPVAPYPSIIFTVEEESEIDNVDATNIGKFLEITANRLKAAGRSATVEAIRCGDHYGATYRRRATVKGSNEVLERLFIETVVDGRRYIIELRTDMGRLDIDRLALLAVFNGLRFPLHAESFDEIDESEEPAAEPESPKQPKKPRAKDRQPKSPTNGEPSGKAPSEQEKPAEPPKTADDSGTSEESSTKPKPASEGETPSKPEAEKPAEPVENNGEESPEKPEKKGSDDVLDDIESLLK
ncbi:hypothetical protein JCM19992_23930 [Thermostilla marina]